MTMKTLDEVIKGVEAYAKLFEEKGCFDCHYREDDCVKSCFLQDELHYLKEYRDLQYGYIKAMADLEDNPPLTWDELKTMKGKPVWVEFEKNGNHWLIITDIKSNGAVGRGVYGENAPLYKDRIGTDWRAYRKERE